MPRTKPRPRPAGRPTVLTDQFAARLYARLGGVTERHARRILAANPAELPPRLWRLVALCIEDGTTDAAEFEELLDGHLGAGG